MSSQDAVDAFLNQLGLNNQTTNKNKKKKKNNNKKDEESNIQNDAQNDFVETPEQLIQTDVKTKTKTKNNKEKPMSTMAKLALQRKKLIEEEEARLKALQEEEERKAKEEEEKIEAERRRIEEIKLKKKQKEKEKIQAQKEAGTYKTERQKEKERYDKLKLEQMKNSVSIAKPVVNMPPENKNKDLYGDIMPNYKSIISCIMGHVDTGKTSLLDKIRDTTVQKGEVGGITQQIGSTFISREILKEKTKTTSVFPIQVPGLLMIDTPGHEAFNNLRKLGSNICDIAILVIDLVAGVEPQTVESLKILKETNTPFIIALNKIDRLYRWKTHPNESFINTFEQQESNTQDEFDTRITKIIVQIMEQGFNAKLYWENDTPEDTISICPVSAITGEGISDLLKTLIIWSQDILKEQITYKNDLECILLETTKIEGYGITLDVIIINGELKVGDLISVNTLNGIKNANIKSLLTVPICCETRIKNDFIQNQLIRASMSVKLIVGGLESTGISGSFIKLQNDINKDMKSLNDVSSINIELEETGVSVFASSMGSLEALLKFLRNECEPPIPVSNVGIGKVMKKDIIKTSIMNEKSPIEYKTVLAFNVEIDEEAEREAKNSKIKILTAEIIYHLFDKYTKYKKEVFERKKEELKDKMSFPCVLKILPDCIFNKKNPLVFGVEVLEGNLHLGTHLCDPINNIYIGKVIGIQNNHKDVEIGKKSSSVCIKVDNQENQNIAFGRQFDETNILYSRISRESLDVLKECFRDDCTKDDLILIVKLKKLFGLC